jgi:hypothetical protein
LANVVPRVTVRNGAAGPVLSQGVVPWLAGQLNSFHAVRIAPPFYFEARARMPAAVGRPWPAIWLNTGSSWPYPNSNNDNLEYEIDVHEGFGDSDRLHATIHWNRKSDNRQFPGQGVVDQPAGVDLSKGMNTWGVWSPSRCRFSISTVMKSVV